MAKKIKELKGITPVQLVSLNKKKQEVSIELTLEVAQKVLKLASSGKGNWKLPENSQFQFDLENGIRLKSITGQAQESE